MPQSADAVARTSHRDHVSRCIVDEVKASRGSRMAGCFLTLDRSRKKCRTQRNTSKRSCRACIINLCECFLCRDVCHVLRDHHKHEVFHRTAIFCLCRRAGNAPAQHRRPAIRIEAGWRHRLLQHHQVLDQSLSRNITITDNAIIPLKKRVVAEFYDPLRLLLKLFCPKT